MKTPWNRTGKIKAILLLFFALSSLLVPIGAIAPTDVMALIVPFLFASIFIPLNCLVLTSNREIVMPHWNDNPLLRRRPLAYFQFAALFLLTVGVGILIGSLIHPGATADFGLICISFGTGMITGIRITLLLRSRPKQG